MELRNFFKKNNSKNSAQNSCEFNQKKPRKKFLKIFAAASLALITCATTLLATAPFGTGAASAATNSNLSNTTQTTSPLGLDPENDPVVYTTSSGLEIKSHNAIVTSYGISPGSFMTGNLNNYQYITLGHYEGTPINWVVIGISNQEQTASTVIWSDCSPAGIAVKEVLPQSKLVTSHLTSLKIIFPNVVQSEELLSREVLLLSEKVLFSAATTSGRWQNFINNTTHNALISWFESDAELTDAYNNGIIIDKTYTVCTNIDLSYYDKGPTNATTTCTTKIFVPSASDEFTIQYGGSFCLNKYLPNANQRIAYNLSGSVSSYVTNTHASGYDGTHIYDTSGNSVYTGANSKQNSSRPVRPIIICKL